jgi:hypothetical protein
MPFINPNKEALKRLQASRTQSYIRDRFKKNALKDKDIKFTRQGGECTIGSGGGGQSASLTNTAPDGSKFTTSSSGTGIEILSIGDSAYTGGYADSSITGGSYSYSKTQDAADSDQTNNGDLSKNLGCWSTNTCEYVPSPFTSTGVSSLAPGKGISGLTGLQDCTTGDPINISFNPDGVVGDQPPSSEWECKTAFFSDFGSAIVPCDGTPTNITTPEGCFLVITGGSGKAGYSCTPSNDPEDPEWQPNYSGNTDPRICMIEQAWADGTGWSAAATPMCIDWWGLGPNGEIPYGIGAFFGQGINTRVQCGYSYFGAVGGYIYTPHDCGTACPSPNVFNPDGQCVESCCKNGTPPSESFPSGLNKNNDDYYLDFGDCTPDDCSCKTELIPPVEGEEYQTFSGGYWRLENNGVYNTVYYPTFSYYNPAAAATNSTAACLAVGDALAATFGSQYFCSGASSYVTSVRRNCSCSKPSGLGTYINYYSCSPEAPYYYNAICNAAPPPSTENTECGYYIEYEIWCEDPNGEKICYNPNDGTQTVSEQYQQTSLVRDPVTGEWEITNFGHDSEPPLGYEVQTANPTLCSSDGLGELKVVNGTNGGYVTLERRYDAVNGDDYTYTYYTALGVKIDSGRLSDSGQYRTDGLNTY